MIVYKLNLLSQPDIRFACATSRKVDHATRNIIDHRENMFELTLNSKIPIQVETETDSRILAAESIALYTPEQRYVLSYDPSTADGTEGIFFSTAVSLSNYELTRCDSDETDNLRELVFNKPGDHSVLLPETMALDEKEQQAVTAMMRTLLYRYLRSATSEYYRCLAAWYELISLLDSMVRSRLRQSLPEERGRETGAFFYAYKTKKYIQNHYSESVSVKDIARSLGLSPNYLSGVFKKEAGISIISYLNYYRTLRIRDLMNQCPDEPLTAICGRVGLGDVRYAERLFKRYMGTSMDLCRKLDDGLTLLHDNPWEKKGLEKDIYESGKTEDNSDTPVDL